MSLTVPRAGNVAGRSATVRVPTPDTGEVFSKLGQVMLEKGLQLKAEQAQTQDRRTQLSITRDLGVARQQVEQTSDADAIGPAWDTAVAGIRERYPDMSENVDLAFTELTDRHGLAIGNRAIGLRQSQREAEWIDTRAALTTEAASADPETLGAFIDLGDAAIQSRLDAGVIDPATAAKERQALRGDIAASRATTQISADPAGFLADADAGAFDALGAEVLAARKVTAQNELDRIAAAAAKDAEIAGKQRETAIGNRLGEMAGLFSKGFAVTDEGFLTDPEVMAHPDFPAAAAAQSLRDELPGIRQMTPAELDAQIAAEKAAPKTHAYQAERLTVLQQWRDSAAANWNTDAVTQSGKAGMQVPELPAFDAEDPDAFTAGLAGRLAFDAYAVEKGYTQSQGIFSKDDQTQLKGILDPKADAGPKVALATAIINGSAGKTDRVLKVLEADPTFARVTTLLKTTGDTGLATQILRGKQKIALQAVNMPTSTQLQSVFDEVTGGAFEDTPQLKAELLAAASAAYADGAAGINPAGAESIVPFMDDTEAVDEFSTSIQRVLGAQADGNGQMMIGGVHRINGAAVALPPGVPVAAVEQTFENLDQQLRGQRRVNDPQYGKGWTSAQTDTPPDPLRSFTAASINGDAPELGKDPSALLSALQMVRVGESDIYELRYRAAGRTYTVRRSGDDRNRAYRFRLQDLIREADK